jgi:hypothetical protein
MLPAALKQLYRQEQVFNRLPANQRLFAIVELVQAVSVENGADS